MRLSLITAACLSLRSTLAVFLDEAYHVDYHFALLGQPQDDTTFFHQPNPASKASLIYTLSERGVLGAVNPRDGSLVWRQVLAQDVGRANASFLRAGEDQDAVVGGVGNRVAAWSAGEGRLVWDHHAPGPLEDVEILEIGDGKDSTSTKDAVVLSSGDKPVVQRLDGATGAVKWQHQLDGVDAPYQLSASTTQVFAILLHKTMLGYYKIRVISLDPVTGKKTDEYTLSSENELATADTIISVGANSASPIIAWTDSTHSALKVNIIGTKTVSSFNIEKHDGKAVERVRLHAPYHTNSLPHFLVHYETASSHWAEVYHVDLKKSKISQAYTLPKVSGKGVFSTSNSDANVYFTRITASEVVTVSSVSHGVLGRWTINGFGVASGSDEVVEPISAVSEVSVKGDQVSAIRSAVLLSTGDWVLERDGKTAWQRPESLADTVSATFTTPQEVQELKHSLEIEAHSNVVSAYVHRITRHMHELQRLPLYLAKVPASVVGSFLGTSTDAGAASDPFGYHKVIACATKGGRIVALDAGDPNRILWSRTVTLIKDGAAARVTQPKIDSCPGVFDVRDESLGPHISVSLNATNGEVVPKGCPPSTAVSAPQGVQYTLKDGALEAGQVGKIDSPSLWDFVPAENERILSLIPRPVNDPVASIGKVLGDRRVLYKYLDTNLALLATAKDTTNTAYFYVLNTVSGAILYSAIHAGVDLSAPISSIISENWFAYSYTALSSDSTSKGHHLVVGEMFESLIPNDRGPFSNQANFSSIESTASPWTLSHTYQIPEPISKLTVTRTQQGITSRQLLAVLPSSNSIVGIAYTILDPRRPVDRDPTKDEQGEGLIRYAPTIEFNPNWYLNHQRELVGIDNVVTSPALVESTSIVFAYGLDIFGTRLSPSFGFDVLGKGFNKFQMLATVAGLFVATLVVAPLVSTSMIDELLQDKKSADNCDVTGYKEASQCPMAVRLSEG